MDYEEVAARAIIDALRSGRASDKLARWVGDCARERYEGGPVDDDVADEIYNFISEIVDDKH